MTALPNIRDSGLLLDSASLPMWVDLLKEVGEKRLGWERRKNIQYYPRLLS
jgi:hypothetical protein